MLQILGFKLGTIAAHKYRWRIGKRAKNLVKVVLLLRRYILCKILISGYFENISIRIRKYFHKNLPAKSMCIRSKLVLGCLIKKGFAGFYNSECKSLRSLSLVDLAPVSNKTYELIQTLYLHKNVQYINTAKLFYVILYGFILANLSL